MASASVSAKPSVRQTTPCGRSSPEALEGKTGAAIKVQEPGLVQEGAAGLRPPGGAVLAQHRAVPKATAKRLPSGPILGAQPAVGTRNTQPWGAWPWGLIAGTQPHAGDAGHQPPPCPSSCRRAGSGGKNPAELRPAAPLLLPPHAQPSLYLPRPAPALLGRQYYSFPRQLFCAVHHRRAESFANNL